MAALSAEDPEAELEDPFDYETRPEGVPFWRHAVAGSCAGIVEHVGMFPLDTVKTLQQASVGGHRSSMSVLDTMQTITRERGFFGVWRGATVIGAGCVPAHIGLFTTYELMKDWSGLSDSSVIGKYVTIDESTKAAMCGGVGAVVHDSVIVPCDVVKQRLQLGLYKDGVDCVRCVLQSEGFWGLYRSLPLTMIGNVPQTAILAATNEKLKRFFGLTRRETLVSEMPLYFVSGAVAGAFAAAITNPVDVVKTRLQVQSACIETSESKNFQKSFRSGKTQGVVDIVRSILRNQGPMGFYNGLLPRVVMAAPASAMCWGTYESLQTLMEKYDPSDSRVINVLDNATESMLGDVTAQTTEEEADPMAWEKRDAGFALWKHCVAGSAAGVMEHVAMYPADTVKTRMQAAYDVDGYLTVRETIRMVQREQGMWGFFRGCTTIGFACIPAHIGLFGTYEISKYHLLDSVPSKDLEGTGALRAALCGALSTAVHDSIIVPCDVVKQRLQLGCYSNALDCVMNVSRSEGIGAFYRSLPSTLLMEMPFYAVLVAMNERLKGELCLKGFSYSMMQGEVKEEVRTSLSWHFLTAGLSGVVASAVTQPLDVVKTRLQTQEIVRSGACQKGGVTYRGLVPTFLRVAREEGVRGLFRGTVPRMVFAAPSAAMCWGTYEAAKSILA
jgi:solute carrier family 25 iron transporter 28/37